MAQARRSKEGKKTVSDDIITVGGLDVASTRDYAAIVLGEVLNRESTEFDTLLRVKGLKIFEHQSYTQLEPKLTEIITSNYVVNCIQDATSEKAFAERLQIIGLPIEPLHITGTVKEDGVSYVLQLRGAGKLGISTRGPFMGELRRQMAEQERTVKGNTIRYDHPSGRHDDAFTALWLMCRAAKPYMEELDFRIQGVGNTL